MVLLVDMLFAVFWPNSTHSLTCLLHIGQATSWLRLLSFILQRNAGGWLLLLLVGVSLPYLKSTGLQLALN